MLRNVPASHLSAKVVSLLNEILSLNAQESVSIFLKAVVREQVLNEVLSLNAQEYQVYSRTKVWPIVPQ